MLRQARSSGSREGHLCDGFAHGVGHVKSQRASLGRLQRRARHRPYGCRCPASIWSSRPRRGQSCRRPQTRLRRASRWSIFLSARLAPRSRAARRQCQAASLLPIAQTRLRTKSRELASPPPAGHHSPWLLSSRHAPWLLPRRLRPATKPIPRRCRRAMARARRPAERQSSPSNPPPPPPPPRAGLHPPL